VTENEGGYKRCSGQEALRARYKRTCLCLFDASWEYFKPLHCVVTPLSLVRYYSHITPHSARNPLKPRQSATTPRIPSRNDRLKAPGQKKTGTGREFSLSRTAESNQQDPLHNECGKPVENLWKAVENLCKTCPQFLKHEKALIASRIPDARGYLYLYLVVPLYLSVDCFKNPHSRGYLKAVRKKHSNSTGARPLQILATAAVLLSKNTYIKTTTGTNVLPIQRRLSGTDPQPPWRALLSLSPFFFARAL